MFAVCEGVVNCDGAGAIYFEEANKTGRNPWQNANVQVSFTTRYLAVLVG